MVWVWFVSAQALLAAVIETSDVWVVCSTLTVVWVVCSTLIVVWVVCSTLTVVWVVCSTLTAVWVVCSTLTAIWVVCSTLTAFELSVPHSSPFELSVRHSLPFENRLKTAKLAHTQSVIRVYLPFISTIVHDLFVFNCWCTFVVCKPFLIWCDLFYMFHFLPSLRRDSLVRIKSSWELLASSLCLCLSVSVCLSLSLSLSLCARARAHTHTHKQTYTHTHIHTHTCIHTKTHAYMISSEQFILLYPKLIWCCIVLRRCVMHKNWDAIFKVKITTRAYLNTIWLFQLCQQYISTSSELMFLL